MPSKLLLTCVALVSVFCQIIAQERIGINTPEPDCTLDITGNLSQYIRAKNNSIGATSVGLELTRGGFIYRDWRIRNHGGYNGSAHCLLRWMM